jgi:hypothetical protein
MGDGAGGLHNRRFNRHRNGYRMRCKPPERRQSQPGFRAFLLNSQPLTGGRTVPETSPGERSQVFLGRSRMDRRVLPQLTDSSEGMPWALMVLSWLPHQMPRHGERCSPVCRQSRTASSGGLWLPQTFTHPRTVTPARRGRYEAEPGAEPCRPVLPSGLATAHPCRCWYWRRCWLLWPMLRTEDHALRSDVTACRSHARQCGDGGLHNNWPGRSAGA